MKVETKGKITKKVSLSEEETEAIMTVKDILFDLEDVYKDYDEDIMEVEYHFKDKEMTPHRLCELLAEITEAWQELPLWE